MTLDATALRTQAVDLTRHPRTRKIAIWLVAIFVALGILLGLVAPPLIRGKVETALSDKLHRRVTIEQIKINPYALTLAVRGFLMRERQSDTPAVSFDEIFVNLELSSLLRLAPVIKALRIVKPYVSLIRNEDRTYNYQDLIDEFSKEPSSGPTPRFSLNNIEVIDGKFDFDDRPEKTKHSITQIKVGVPFVSSLPSYVDITVKPEFSAVVNGAPLRLAGDSKPFKDSHESTLALDIDKLEIAKYLEYSPVGLNFTLPSGQLGGKLTAAFRTSKNNPAVLSIAGNLGIKDLDMRQSGGAPLVKLPNLEVLIEAFQVFASKLALKSIKADGLEVHLIRDRDGGFNVAHLVAAAEPKPVEAKEPEKTGTPFGFSIGEIALGGATLLFTDEQPQHPYKTRLENIQLKIAGLSNDVDKKATAELSFDSENKEKFSHRGTLQLAPLLAEGKLAIEGLKPGALRSYYESALAAEIKDGSLDISGQYSFASKDGQSDLNLSALEANLRNFRLELAGQPAPLWRIASLAIKDGALDLGKKTISIGAIEAREGTGYIQRQADGAINLARITKAQSAGATQAQPGPPAKKTDAEWRVDTKEIRLDRFKIDYEDQANPTSAKLSLSDISLRGDNFSTARNQRGKATLRLRVNNKGAINLIGTAMMSPLNAKFVVDGRDIELVPFQPYLADRVNFILTGGRIGTKGELSYDANGGAAKLNYRGAVNVAEFGSVEKDGAQDLLKWKSLALDGLSFDLDPFQLRIGEITLADFYSRLIIGPDGKVNLQNLTVAKDGKTDQVPAPEKVAAKSPPPAPAGESTEPKAITIGKINLQEGNINFSDFFVKPNYSANLTSVQGAISELKPETAGDLDLQARLDNAAPVEIKGKINPLSKELFLDIVADAKEIELSPMSPYSGKYVGYGIEKGKLSFNVKYKLENRKLSAENKIILNQLTFGDKIESPTATKLPVLLAVALMKDRNGVIDVDLPISGSLDDPQFSVGGIVLRIIINIITKAVTAPFSLIASAFGGGGSGDELAYIEFDNGRANLSQTAQGKVATLAKALNNRPALNLEITGRADPLTDLDGLKRVQIERKVKAQKLKALARQGEAPRSVDDVQVSSTEYPQYLKTVYGDESFPKPRNIIGLAQDLPVPEMEKLMMQYAKVGDEEMNQLAAQRAQAVRDALLASKLVGAERLFVVSARPLSAEERAKLKGRPNRVDFAMK